MTIRSKAVAAALLTCLAAAPPPPADLRFVPDEAQAVLALLAAREAGKNPGDEDLRAVFDSEGYRRLKERETGMGRSFTDADFRAFVTSPELRSRRAALAATLARWRAANIEGAKARALAYLPAGTRLRAAVYPVIKPATNSFVFDTARNPAIFLYLDPKTTPAQFENTVAHELHHIGISAACAGHDEGSASPEAQAAGTWFGAFGEGVAMLAAAGGPDIHPHSVSPPEDRRRWDADMRHYDPDFRTLVTFFGDVEQGRLKGDAVVAAARTFYGIQGPWYTVGWRMASLIEKEEGRRELVASLCSPRRFAADYNRAASRTDPRLPLWPQSLIDGLPKS